MPKLVSAVLRIRLSDVPLPAVLLGLLLWQEHTKLSLPRPPDSEVEFDLESPGKELYSAFRVLAPDAIDERGNVRIPIGKQGFNISGVVLKSLFEEIDYLHVSSFKTKYPKSAASYVTERFEHDDYKSVIPVPFMKQVDVLERSGRIPETAMIYADRDRLTVVRFVGGPSSQAMIQSAIAVILSSIQKTKK